jgi:hypothetical protein
LEDCGQSKDVKLAVQVEKQDVHAVATHGNALQGVRQHTCGGNLRSTVRFIFSFISGIHFYLIHTHAIEELGLA